MSLVADLPASILGGDPFNQFRFLYRRELLWKLFDEDYCLSVMRAAYQAGGRAFDLSFEVNTRLFHRLKEETGDELIGMANTSWEQGVVFNGKYIQHHRDRILKTLVERCLPRNLADQVEKKLSHEDVLVFGYDRTVEPLSEAEVASIRLDEDLFLKRLSIFSECQIITLGGADADWLISLGRMDIVKEMVRIVRREGFLPMLLCSYASYAVDEAEKAGLDVEGYVVPLNREWSWFDRDGALQAVRRTDKPVVAFMPLAGGSLRQDVNGALTWLYRDAGVTSILFGTAAPDHAAETTRLAAEMKNLVAVEKGQ